MFDAKITTIRQAQYGKEIRKPIVEALEAIQSNLISKNPDIESEVRNARGTYDTLDARVSDLGKGINFTEIQRRLQTAEEVLNRKLQE